MKHARHLMTSRGQVLRYRPAHETGGARHQDPHRQCLDREQDITVGPGEVQAR
ncbi:MAG: hypothetical protein JWO13_3900, partial [Acidobacteriales bacterium]|nr:hypothetical protein [Terriglobales bacterium]